MPPLAPVINADRCGDMAAMRIEARMLAQGGVKAGSLIADTGVEYAEILADMISHRRTKKGRRIVRV